LEDGITELGHRDFNEVTPTVYCLKPEMLTGHNVGFIYVYTPWCDVCISHITDLYEVVGISQSFGKIFAINAYNTDVHNDQLVLDLGIHEYPMAFLVNKMGYMTPYNYIISASSIYASMMHLNESQEALMVGSGLGSKRRQR
jgi:hypothetical protein